MEPFRHHVYVCTQRKMEGIPSCPAAGAEELLDALRREVRAAGLQAEVMITACGCLGLCGEGPNLVVYPEGVWYAKVTPADAAELVQSHLGKGRPVARLCRSDAAALKAEIEDHQKKVEAMKAAQDAAGVPPDELMATIRGFQESRIVLSALELDVFTAVGAGGTAAIVAGRLQTDLRATAILLNALAALKLLQKLDGVFTLTPVASRFLAAGGKDDSRDALLHSANLWQRWRHLTEVVRTGEPPAFEEMTGRGEDWTRTFIAAMHKNGSLRALQVARMLDLGGVSRLLDLGGGSGAYAIAFSRQKPDLEAYVFDLPTVIPLTRKYAAEAGLDRRIKTVAGDMRTAPLGENYDLVWISAICHMWSPTENQELFRRVHAALRPGGRIVIQDFILAPDKTSPRMGAVFAVNMLVGTRRGNAYSQPEYFDWLTRAGFQNPEIIKMPGPSDMVAATRPRS